jgi:hypothetical protein
MSSTISMWSFIEPIQSDRKGGEVRDHLRDRSAKPGDAYRLLGLSGLGGAERNSEP